MTDAKEVTPSHFYEAPLDENTEFSFGDAPLWENMVDLESSEERKLETAYTTLTPRQKEFLAHYLRYVVCEHFKDVGLPRSLYASLRPGSDVVSYDNDDTNIGAMLDRYISYRDDFFDSWSDRVYYTFMWGEAAMKAAIETRALALANELLKRFGVPAELTAPKAHDGRSESSAIESPMEQGQVKPLFNAVVDVKSFPTFKALITSSLP
ncbi:Hypothetical protein POVN_LOCUS631 [uncultured virus]|nr:Hypothetical protein POVN_LOCUS631 [uncultured virus]